RQLWRRARPLHPRNGDGADGPRRRHLGSERQQPAVGVAQRLRDRRRLHGQQLLREPERHLYGADCARGGFRRERTEPAEPVESWARGDAPARSPARRTPPTVTVRPLHHIRLRTLTCTRGDFMETSIALDLEPTPTGALIVRALLRISGEPPAAAARTPLNLA